MEYFEKYAGFGKSNMCKIVMEIRLVDFGWEKKLNKKINKLRDVVR